MSVDPIVYNGDKYKHPSLCSACIDRQTEQVFMMTGYCVTACRCDGCGRTADLAMCRVDGPLNTIDGAPWRKNTDGPAPVEQFRNNQNRPYPSGTLMVRATLTVRGVPSVWEFNWNDRDSVRRFAADSDRCIRAGGTTALEPLKE